MIHSMIFYLCAQREQFYETRGHSEEVESRGGVQCVTQVTYGSYLLAHKVLTRL